MDSSLATSRLLRRAGSQGVQHFTLEATILSVGWIYIYIYIYLSNILNATIIPKGCADTITDTAYNSVLPLSDQGKKCFQENEVIIKTSQN